MIRHASVPVFLLACLLLGGASAAGFTANFILQITSLPLIGWALWTMLQERPPAQIRAPLGLLAIFVTIAVLQLVPLPPALWTLLPGRAWVVDGYRLLGIPLPWLPLTLAPDIAPSSLLWLLPAIAVLLSVVVLGAFLGRWIAATIVSVTLASVALGALQVIGGTGAYLYAITNYGVAVGFFANANHNATLLLVCIPFLAALQATLLRRQTRFRTWQRNSNSGGNYFDTDRVHLADLPAEAGGGVCLQLQVDRLAHFDCHLAAVIGIGQLNVI